MDAPTVSPGSSQAIPAGSVESVDLLMPFAFLVPLVLIIFVLLWASQKKDRKSRVVESSYALIALELILILVLPACNQALTCTVFSLIPVLMFAMLVAFMFHRSRREVQHEVRVIKAIKDGHLKHSDVLAGRLEDDIKQAEKKEHKREEAKKLAEERAPKAVSKKTDTQAEQKSKMSHESITTHTYSLAPAQLSERNAKAPETARFSTPSERQIAPTKSMSVDHEEIERVLNRVLQRKPEEQRKSEEQKKPEEQRTPENQQQNEKRPDELTV